MDDNSAMCSLSISDCPIHQSMGIDPDIAHSHTCHDPYNHTLQSLDYPIYAESLHMPKGNVYHNNYDREYENQFDDHLHEIMMNDNYSHNQDKITGTQIRELKVKTFPYLSMMMFDSVCQTGILSEKN